MNSIPFTPIRKIFEEAGRREALGETIIHLEVGRPDFETPGHIKAAAVRAASIHPYINSLLNFMEVS